MYFWNGITKQKIGASLIFSGILFLICMSLDFYITNTVSQGDFTEEANIVGRLWWQLLGQFRFIEIPLWIGVVFGMAYIINFKSKFLALLWLNFLALNHLIGFLTWFPIHALDFLYTLVKEDWARGYAISLISVPVGAVFAFLQTKIKLR